MSSRLIIILSILIPEIYFSQSALDMIQTGQDLNVLYRNEQSFHAFLGTRGWGFGYRRGKHITGTLKGIFEIEGAYMKHPKEVRLSGTADVNKNFVYGKLNTIMMLRCGVGSQNTIFKKADKKAVEIRLTYLIEGNLSFAKPYYIQIPGEGGIHSYQYVKYDPNKYTIDSIIGRGPFLDGFDQIKIYPGITGKLITSIEYASLSYKIRAIELGLVADFFPKALPIMARNPAEHLIVTLNLGIVFGKRWF